MRKNTSLIVIAIIFMTGLASAQTYDFVTCGSSGSSGPSDSDCDSYYSGDNTVDIIGSGMQKWDVPQDGKYRIKASGASGSLGDGAIMRGVFSLDEGDDLLILVGQQPYDDGGAGGTFVAKGSSYSSADPLIVAGGGAGGDGSYSSALDGSTSTSGNDAPSGPSGGTDGDGGEEGNAGCCGADGGGGGGFLYDGDDADGGGGSSFRNGGTGATNGDSSGGFGGGGAAESYGDEAGGAGGYSGGGAAQDGGDETAGGGGSFIHSSATEAASSDGNFGTTGSEPHGTYSGAVMDLNNWNSGDGGVTITLITNPDDPVIENLNFDSTPGDPATIEGDLDVSIDDDDGNAPNNQLESCTVTAEGLDSGGEVTKNGNINGNSCNFTFDSDDNANWDLNEELSITINVTDSYGGTDELTQLEQFPVNPPNAPDSPQPTDEEDTVSTGHDLQVRATHPDGLDMEVRFFLDDGSGFSQVGPTRDASDGDTVSVSPDLDPGTDYTWKARATKEGNINESNEWTFTTNYRPSVESMSVEDLDSGHAVSFSSVVEDEDGRNQIDGCDLVVRDGEGNTANPAVSMSAGDSPNEAICSVDRIDFQDSDWSHLEDLDFDLTVTDDLGLSDSDTTGGELPNHRPAIQSLRTEDYPDRQAFRITSLIGAVDSDVDEIRSCTLVIDDGENSYSAGNMVEVNSTHVRCIQENVGSGQFSTLTVDEEIDIRLRATDIHGATSSDDIAFNVPTGIDYRYSSLIISAGGVDFLPFQVSNNQQVDTEYEVELQNVNASFSSNGETTKTFTLSGRSAESMSIRVSPDVEFTGTKTLEIVTKNLATGINQTHEIPVRVRETGSSSRRPVPGIGLAHVIALVLAAFLIYGRSLNLFKGKKVL